MHVITLWLLKVTAVLIIYAQAVKGEGINPANKHRHTTTKSNFDDDGEKRLVKWLFRGYKKEVRPVIKKEDAVTVRFGIAYTQLLDLDEKNQMLISNVWVRMNWKNLLLTWEPEKFGGITTINVDPSLVWVPDIVLYNNAEEKLGAGQMDQFQTKIILQSNGRNTWYSPTILKSRCPINVEYFPFDDQKCPLKFISWTYDGSKVNLTHLVENSTKADLQHYLSSGEFDLLSANAVRDLTKYTCCENPYPHLTFTIHIKRKTLFYFNNLIIPCFLITILGLLTFLLPPSSGERVTLVITTLLAMTVFMLMIAEQTPTTSKVTPLIGKFFIASMVIIGLSLVATCIVLNIYECSRHFETVPKSIRVFVFDYLAPFLCVRPPLKPLPGEDRNRETDMKIHADNTTENVNKIMENGKQNVMHNEYKYPLPSWNSSGHCSHRQRGKIAKLPREISEGIATLSNHTRQQERFDEIAGDWEAVARVADRFFFIIFLLIITTTTTYIFLTASS